MDSPSEPSFKLVMNKLFLFMVNKKSLNERFELHNESSARHVEVYVKASCLWAYSLGSTPQPGGVHDVIVGGVAASKGQRYRRAVEVEFHWFSHTYVRCRGFDCWNYSR